jgi:hypothetical protein
VARLLENPATKITNRNNISDGMYFRNEGTCFSSWDDKQHQRWKHIHQSIEDQRSCHITIQPESETLKDEHMSGWSEFIIFRSQEGFLNNRRYGWDRRLIGPS